MERRFRSSDWMIIGAAALLLVASVLPWWRVSIDEGFDMSKDAYEFTMTGQVPVIALVVIAVLIVIIRTESLPLPSSLIHPYVLTPPVVAVAILVGDRFLFSGYGDTSVSRGVGLYLALVAVVVMLAGCGFAIRDERRGVVAGTGAEEADDDEDWVDPADLYGYGDEGDDLAQRFNAALPTGDAGPRRVRKPARSADPTAWREAAARETPSRRRAPRATEEPPTVRTRRRPRGAPPA